MASRVPIATLSRLPSPSSASVALPPDVVRLVDVLARIELRRQRRLRELRELRAREVG